MPVATVAGEGENRRTRHHFPLSVRIYFFVPVLGGILLASAMAWAGPLKETYWLEENGIRAKFEVARDEVHDDRVVRHLPMQASADELRRAVSGTAKSELVLYPAGAAHLKENRRLVTKQVAVRLAPDADPTRLAAVGVKVIKTLGRDRRWTILESGPEPGSALEAAEALRRVPGVLAVEPQLAHQQRRRATTPNDPLFHDEWHLDNTGQEGGQPGIDIDVRSVWDSFRGAGVVIGSTLR